MKVVFSGLLPKGDNSVYGSHKHGITDYFPSLIFFFLFFFFKITFLTP